uniref:hypothetical protein n=1 Tax=Treponema endosymbiont of Eucomonympha sp. TaxID=1580831 RepID=UPI00164FD79E
LTAADVGREVYYDGSAGREFGVISTWNDRFVFVRYPSSKWAQGTLPRLLSFSPPAEERPDKNDNRQPV